jgi:hypothetical protein
MYSTDMYSGATDLYLIILPKMLVRVIKFGGMIINNPVDELRVACYSTLLGNFLLFLFLFFIFIFIFNNSFLCLTLIIIIIIFLKKKHPEKNTLSHCRIAQQVKPDYVDFSVLNRRIYPRNLKYPPGKAGTALKTGSPCGFADFLRSVSYS